VAALVYSQPAARPDQSWTLSGDHGGSPLLGGGIPPPLTPVQDLLGMG